MVIGNRDYKEAPLRNPVNDAEDIGQALRKLGFSVTTTTNVNQKEFEDAINEFARRIIDAHIAVFYFSGHGCQAKGENYLLPVGYAFNSEADLRHKAVSAGFVLDKMEEAKSRLKIMVLDACRDNPFKGVRSASRGLTQMSAPDGSFIAYATAPGKVAKDGEDRNSPYAKHLLSAIELKGLDIEQVFRIVTKEVKKEQMATKSRGESPTSQRNSSSIRLRAQGERVNRNSPGVEKPRGLVYSEKERLEMEKRESEREIAKLREARRVAALERERLGREKQEMQREMDRQKQQDTQRVASLPAPTPPRPSTSEESEVAKLRRQAEQGNAWAQSTLGDKYLRGTGVAKDYEEAVKWYRKAADQGYSWAQSNLGWMYANGTGVAKDYEEAVKWYRKAAEQGNAAAQDNLGRMYQNGWGVPKDYGEAVKWCKKSADQGNSYAQNNLGGCAENGIGVPKEYAEAVKWYMKAAENGNSVAQYNLGRMYKNGNGVAKGQAGARKWFQKAADQGNEQAKKELQNLGATSSK